MNDEEQKTDRDSTRYAAQDRGSLAGYEAYFAGMDRSMQQKIALTTAHFPTHGRIADMGSGSGRGTYDLACLYGGLQLTGVDINPTSVQISRDQFRRPNLAYETGDISQKVFPEKSLDGILDSSVLHHVTSFNDFDVDRVRRTLDNQVAQLKEHGVLIIRDFVIPDGPATVHLDLPADDGAADGPVPQLSTAALFSRFGQQWRSSMNRNGPVPFRELPCPRPGHARFETRFRIAAEFVLRKDYREDWDVEILEEYTYMSQQDFEQAFRARGMRIVASMPIWNPWILENRFEGRFHLQDPSGAPVPFPPTNYLIVGEKTDAGEGVEIREVQSRDLSSPSFLKLHGYRHRESGRIFELVERPNQTMDLLPWYETGGQIFVLAKKDFPRPIVNAAADQPELHGSRLSGYVTEPISAIVPPAQPEEDAVRQILLDRAGIESSEIEAMDAPSSYYTSPGGINERVSARRVRIRPRAAGDFAFRNYTPFRSAGSVRELDAAQTLRASQVGGMFDARLEMNIYLLLRSLNRPPGSWIGATPALRAQDAAVPADPAALFPAARAAYEKCELPQPSFLSIRRGRFHELDATGKNIAEAEFEYVLPSRFSKNTVSAIPVVKADRGIFVGIEHRDLPALQAFTGSSAIATVPAWRLPAEVTHRSQLPAFVAAALQKDFAVRTLAIRELGGPYYATPGVTPELVHPYMVELDAASLDATTLHFVDAIALRDNLPRIQDGHLLLSSCRLLHSLHLL